MKAIFEATTGAQLERRGCDKPQIGEWKVGRHNLPIGALWNPMQIRCLMVSDRTREMTQNAGTGRVLLASGRPRLPLKIASARSASCPCSRM